MPSYVTSPFKAPVQLLVPGTPSYVLGSFNNRTGPTTGRLISDAGVTTTGTAVFQIQSGNAPVAGSLITILGASNSPNFNVTNAVIISASTNMDTGVCTVTFAITSTNQGTLPDNGLVIIPQPEVGETVVNGASVPVSASFSTANPDQGRVVTAIISFPTIPTTVTGVFLQGADQDIDAPDLAGKPPCDLGGLLLAVIGQHAGSVQGMTRYGLGVAHQKQIHATTHFPTFMNP